MPNSIPTFSSPSISLIITSHISSKNFSAALNKDGSPALLVQLEMEFSLTLPEIAVVRNPLFSSYSSSSVPSSTYSVASTSSESGMICLLLE